MLRSDKNLSRVLLELVCNEFLLWGGDLSPLLSKVFFFYRRGRSVHGVTISHLKDIFLYVHP